jgi:hypothetical protein
MDLVRIRCFDTLRWGPRNRNGDSIRRGRRIAGLGIFVRPNTGLVHSNRRHRLDHSNRPADNGTLHRSGKSWSVGGSLNRCGNNRLAHRSCNNGRVYHRSLVHRGHRLPFCTSHTGKDNL